MVTVLNIDIAFKVAWAGIMKIGKLTYIVAKAKKAMFIEISLTKSDISFVKSDQYTILFLKWSKTNTEYI